ncbi:hypothetical protein MHI39_07290 [Heyndrickxia sp. FSL K6-6286]|uniref:hypothetical protein n=1 Tax=Heyndrickxia sp. FSL K6-6286 TaxID=2921510 RepID=UPI00315A372B
MTLEFELYEQYRKEQQTIKESHRQFMVREQEALEKYTELKHKYQRTLEESVKDGKDLTADLDKLDEEIQEAKKLYERRKQERLASNTINKGATKRVDILKAFRGEYTQKVQNEVLPSIYDRVNYARDLILSALLDLYNARDEYDGITAEIKEISLAAKESGETPHHLYISNPVFSNHSDFEGHHEIANIVSRLITETNRTIRDKELPSNATYIADLKGVNK